MSPHRFIISLNLVALLFLTGSPVHADFSDVSSSHPNATAIDYVETEGIVNGYSDGTYKPDQSINRAEFTKIVVGAAFEYDPSQDPSGYDIYALVGLNFSDVIDGEWYIPYVRRAVEEGVIEGYPDGTYRPAQTINFVEAAKIIVISFGIETEPGEVWYEPYVVALGDSNAIPTSIDRLDSEVTRGEMAEMIWRIHAEIEDQPSLAAEDLLSSGECIVLEEPSIANVDMDVVKSTWLAWYNEEREKELLDPYTYNPQLHSTASVWSQYSAAQGMIDHKRPGQSDYYDYELIKRWFSDLGIEFANVNTRTFTENIGTGLYLCSDDDCTQELIDAIRTTFDFYMSEKYESYQPHYTSVMNPYFTEIGMSIALKGNDYYITTHYGTSITSDPPPICPSLP